MFLWFVCVDLVCIWVPLQVGWKCKFFQMFFDRLIPIQHQYPFEIVPIVLLDSVLYMLLGLTWFGLEPLRVISIQSKVITGSIQCNSIQGNSIQGDFSSIHYTPI
ncbi:hypothetical protein ACB092_07G005700 [Castanea dentata]